MLTKRDLLKLMGAAPCAFAAMPVLAAQRRKAIASFSILGDFVKNVAGDRLDLGVLVGSGADAHTYSASPADSRLLKDADIIFENGLGFEGWIDRLITASGTKARVVIASDGAQLRKAAGDHDHGHNHGHDDAAFDPHAWQQVSNAKVYVANIGKALIALDPDGKATYEANVATYSATLDALDAEIRRLIGTIPEKRRVVVTTHDAFGYFGEAYGLRFLSPQGLSSDSEPSARDMAKLIRQIKREKIGAVFIESISDPRLMQQISRETGAKIGAGVFSDSLSPPDGPAATYVAMMKHNADTFVKALAP